MKTTLLIIAAIISMEFMSPHVWDVSVQSSTWVDYEVNTIKQQNGDLDDINDNVLRLALTAYANATRKGYADKPVLTIIDYSLPSSEKRLWVLDLQSNRILFDTWVAHGKNSGGDYATSFSNNPGSHKTSLGTFITGETYDSGKNGLSLKLYGLEPGVNNLAYQRDIVIHGAAYTTPTHVGRSWGCPAVEKKLAKPIIDTIKDKSVLFAYYPDVEWLDHSSFLT